MKVSVIFQNDLAMVFADGKLINDGNRPQDHNFANRVMRSNTLRNFNKTERVIAGKSPNIGSMKVFNYEENNASPQYPNE